MNTNPTNCQQCRGFVLTLREVRSLQTLLKHKKTPSFFGFKVSVPLQGTTISFIAWLLYPVRFRGCRQAPILVNHRGPVFVQLCWKIILWLIALNPNLRYLHSSALLRIVFAYFRHTPTDAACTPPCPFPVLLTLIIRSLHGGFENQEANVIISLHPYCPQFAQQSHIGMNFVHTSDCYAIRGSIGPGGGAGATIHSVKRYLQA